MAGHLCVPGRVTIRRVITTVRPATCLTRAQMDPFATNLHAFVTLVPLRLLDRRDGADVSAALIRHGVPLLLKNLMDERDGNGSLANRRRQHAGVEPLPGDQ